MSSEKGVLCDASLFQLKAKRPDFSRSLKPRSSETVKFSPAESRS
jgi:hypothetical protein